MTRSRIPPLIFLLAFLGITAIATVVAAEPNAAYSATIPHVVFMVFQMMFAVITPALVIGAFAGRVKFSTLCLFALLWATFVYAPVTHWVWGDGGFLRAGGTLDFAGGIVVHINDGIAALVAALMLERRIGYPNNVAPPHNLPFAVLGAGLLWFGWFGFNAGSALLGAQGKATLVTAAWSLVGTSAILKALDLTGHRESAYTLLD